LVDIFPTVLECVGAKPKFEDLEKPGTSLIKLAQENEMVERIIFSEYHAAGSITGIFMIRTKTYKYVYYVGYEPQLFNLENDPDELTDLAQETLHIRGSSQMCEIKLRQICNPEEIDKKCRKDQDESCRVLWRQGKIPKIGTGVCLLSCPEKSLRQKVSIYIYAE
jgi:choline-sulfatase